MVKVNDERSTANMFEMVTDKANINTAIEYGIAYDLSISIFKFNLDLFKTRDRIHIGSWPILKIKRQGYVEFCFRIIEKNGNLLMGDLAGECSLVYS